MLKGKTIGNNNLALAGAAVLILVRLAVDTFDINWDLRIFAILITLITLSYLGIREQRLTSKEYLTYIMEWKAAMRPAAVTAVIYAVFTYVFYRFVAPGFFEELVTSRKSEILETAKKNNIPAEDVDNIMANFNAMSELVFTPLNWSTFTLMGMLLFSMIFCALTVVIVRKFKGLVK